MAAVIAVVVVICVQIITPCYPYLPHVVHNGRVGIPVVLRLWVSFCHARPRMLRINVWCSACDQRILNPGWLFYDLE